MLEIRDRATSWKELHEGLADYTIEIRKRGAGFVFRDLEGGTMEKASTVDRQFSKKQLEEKFGPYQKQERLIERKKARTKYQRRPLDPRLEKHPAWKRMTQTPTGKRLSWRRFLEQQAGVDAEAREALELQKAYFQILTGQTPHKIKSRKPKGMSR